MNHFKEVSALGASKGILRVVLSQGEKTCRKVTLTLDLGRSKK